MSKYGFVEGPIDASQGGYAVPSPAQPVFNQDVRKGGYTPIGHTTPSGFTEKDYNSRFKRMDGPELEKFNQELASVNMDNKLNHAKLSKQYGANYMGTSTILKDDTAKQHITENFYNQKTNTDNFGEVANGGFIHSKYAPSEVREHQDLVARHNQASGVGDTVVHGNMNAVYNGNALDGNAAYGGTRGISAIPASMGNISRQSDGQQLPDRQILGGVHPTEFNLRPSGIQQMTPGQPTYNGVVPGIRKLNLGTKLNDFRSNEYDDSNSKRHSIPNYRGANHRRIFNEALELGNGAPPPMQGAKIKQPRSKLGTNRNPWGEDAYLDLLNSNAGTFRDWQEMYREL